MKGEETTADRSLSPKQKDGQLLIVKRKEQKKSPTLKQNSQS